MANTLRIAVLGDSVAWGQGLLPEHKYAYKVATALGQPPGNVDLQAHSGAIIGISLDQTATSIYPEIPDPAPKIVSQIGNVADPGTVDVVLIDGGINDVGIQNIFNPMTSATDLGNLTARFCYYDMLTLLGTAVSTFTKPTCRFILTGYYPVLSAQSRPVASVEGGDPLAKLLEIFAPGCSAVFDESLVLNQMILLSQQFATDSEAWLSKAVQDAIIRYDSGLSIPLGKRMAFVSSGIGAANSLFAPDCLIWGFASDLGPEDEVAPLREGKCDIQYPGLLNLPALAMCYHASIGQGYMLRGLRRH
jgi:hypothetical protein